MSINKFLNSKAGSFFLILPFIKPASELTGDFDIIFDLWKVISVLLIAMGYMGKKHHKHQNVMIAIVLMQLVFVFSTWMHWGDLKTVIVDAVSNIGICLYMDYLCERSLVNAARNFAIPCATLAFISASSMFIFYPQGMYMVDGTSSVNYFWGFDNASAFRMLPSLYFLCLYAIERNEKKVYRWSFLFCVYCTGAFIYVHSMTAGAMLVIITFAFGIVIQKKRGIKILNIRNMLILSIVISLFLLINKDNITALMNFGLRNDKYGSLRLRFTIWRRTIEQWRRSPIFGFGVEYPQDTMRKLILDHPHNLFLDILYHGGVVALEGLLFLLYKIFANRQRKTRINSITAISLFALIILSQMDFYNAQYLFYPMILMCYFKSRKAKMNVVKVGIMRRVVRAV